MKAQHGATLLAMLVVLVLGAAWFTVTAIGNPIDRTAEERMHNAAILQEAKTALIGYVAHHAAMSGENDPGALPCPEAAGNIGTANEGIAAGNCTLPAVGRLPWRTLGLDKWRDAAGEPLWYVVSPGWGKPNAVTNTVINSNSTGQLTLEGAADVVGLIISPGRPLQVSASASCLARVQRRTTPSPAIDFRDYLECENATPADAIFASAGPAGSFNDQVLSLTGAEILPAIEAGIADRFERTVAPALLALYFGGPADAQWLSANPVLPFAAPFAPDPAASAFKGTFAQTAGLLPVSLSETAPGSGIACTVAGQGQRCDPAFVSWTAAALAGAGIASATCVATPAQIDCTFYRRCLLACGAGNMAFTLTATAANVGMAMRQLNKLAAMTNISPDSPLTPRTSTGVVNNDGSATITLQAQAQVSAGVGFAGALGDLLCGLLAVLEVCKAETISVPIAFLADHPILDPAVPNAFSWFFRNNWHQVSYYALGPDVAPGGPGVCGVNCVTVNFRTPAVGHRGILVIAGRGMGGQTRLAPIATKDWLEDTNCDLAAPPAPADCVPDLTFTARAPTLMINRAFNDRIAVIAP